MKKILAFSASASKKSINALFIEYIASRISNHAIEIINLHDYEAPFYSVEIEEKNGVPPIIKKLYELFEMSDAFIISCPEYNSSVPAFFKNTTDWLSRIDRTFFRNKPMLFFSTSPGPMGGSINRRILEKTFPRFNSNIRASYSLPNFYDNFNLSENQLIENDKKKLVDAIIKEFEKNL